MEKVLRGVFRIYSDGSLVDHRWGSGFGDDPSFNYELLYENGNFSLWEDYYIHCSGCSKKRKIGNVKKIELIKVFSEDELVLKVIYEENLGDWEYY